MPHLSLAPELGPSDLDIPESDTPEPCLEPKPLPPVPAAGVAVSPASRTRAALAQRAESWKAGPLPPHLEPNPITGAFSSPSVFQKVCSALLSWVLLAIAFVLVIFLGRKAEARSHAVDVPRTVTVLFESPANLEPGPPPPPEPRPSGGASSETPTESTSAYFDPRALAHPELAETPVPDSMVVPMETNLLPTRPVIYSGGTAPGTPGVMGAGSGGPGGGSEHVARWGDGGLISGERRGLTVAVDSLDVLHQEIPKYPPAAKAAKIAGEVVVDVVINEKGIPIEILVVRSDHIMLTPTVLEVAPRWRFTPVLFGGQRVRANFRVCFRFILETI